MQIQRLMVLDSAVTTSEFPIIATNTFNLCLLGLTVSTLVRRPESLSFECNYLL